MFAHPSLRLPNGLVRRIAFRAGREVHGALGQDNSGFWPTDALHRLEGVVGQHQRGWIRVANVLRRRDQQSTGNEFGVFASFHHSGEVVNCRVGIAGPNAFDECADDVVMGLSPFVVVGMWILDPLGHRFVGHNQPSFRVRFQPVHHQFKRVEQPSRISATGAQQGLLLRDDDLSLGHAFVLVQGALNQPHQNLGGQRLQHVGLASGAQGRDDFKGWVFCGGTNQGHGACFHRAEQAVLLRFGKPVNLVDEQKGPSGKHAVSFGRVEHSPHVLDSTVDGAERVKGTVRLCGNQPRQRGFPDPWRPPQNHAWQRACLHGPSQHSAVSYKVLLSYVFVERLGPHALCEGGVTLHAAKLGELCAVTARMARLSFGSTVLPSLVGPQPAGWIHVNFTFEFGQTTVQHFSLLQGAHIVRDQFVGQRVLPWAFSPDARIHHRHVVHVGPLLQPVEHRRLSAQKVRPPTFGRVRGTLIKTHDDGHWISVPRDVHPGPSLFGSDHLQPKPTP